MNHRLDDLEIAAAVAVLPTSGETATVMVAGEEVNVAAFAEDPRLSDEVPRRICTRIDRFTAVAYRAAARALAEVGDQPDPDRVGVFLANTRAGWAYGEVGLTRLVQDGPAAMPTYQATAWFPAAAQGELTIALGLRGCAKTTSGSVTGFAEALWLARDALERGDVDLALAGAAESLLSGFVLGADRSRRVLASGPAEGAVTLALRRPTGPSGIRLHDLRLGHRPRPSAVEFWAPSLAMAAALHQAVTSLPPDGPGTDVALGGSYCITVHRGDR